MTLTLAMPEQYAKRRDESSSKKIFFLLAFQGPDGLPFPALILADANSYTVPHAAGGSVRRKTP